MIHDTCYKIHETCDIRHKLPVETKTRTYVPRARRDGAAHSGTAEWVGDGQHGTPTGSRGPISIFGPIFKVEDRSEDPDLRIAEGSWWPLGGGRQKKYQGGFFVHSSGREGGRWGGSSFFGSRKWNMGGLFVLRTRKIEEPPPSSKNPPYLRRRPTPPPFIRPIFDLFFEAEDRRWRGSSIFGVEDRRLKMVGSSIFGSEDRRWGVFDPRLRRSKMGSLRSSAPKIED